MANELHAPRKRIDAIDRSIISLLAKRISLSKRIGAIKKKVGAAILDAKRERQVLRNAQAHAKRLGLSKEYAQGVFALILRNSMKNQR